MACNLRPTHLRCEYETAPLGLDRVDPRFSWELEALARGATQAAWRIQVSGGDDFDGELAWDSGRVEGGDQAQIPYAGAAPQAHDRYRWRVKVWDADGGESDWSEPAAFAIGILDRDEWQRARWISHHQQDCRAVPHLRRDFTVDGAVRDARLYVTAKGVVDLEINGRPASADQLTPGWTEYHKRILHRCWDVTGLVQQGENAIGAMLAEGWYKGPLTWNRKAQVWGKRLAVLCMLRIETEDGFVHWVCSDDQWRSATGNIASACLFDGEQCDATRHPEGWSSPGYDDATWQPVVAHEVGDEPALGRHPGPPVVRWRELPTVDQWEQSPGRWVLDLGQNIAGRVRLKLDVPAGTVVRLRFAEVLDSDRDLYVDNLRTALATDLYVARGGGEETWEPRFTFHGFQFVEITGLPYAPEPDTVTGVVLFSDCPEVGRFTCSDAMVTKLASNVVWTQRANFVEIPTDCPQRDERLGWTGDAQAFIQTASCYHDIAAFFTKWLQDLEDGCHSDGRVPAVAPNGPVDEGPWWETSGGMLTCMADAAWGDAATICPATIGRVYGDRDLLATRYGMMTGYLGFYRRTTVPGRRVRYRHHTMVHPDGSAGRAPNLFGDWLAVNASTAPEVIMTAFYAWSARQCRDAARLLGRDADAETFDAEYREVCADFCSEFVDEDGHVTGRSQAVRSQTGYALALHFDLLPEELRPLALGHLVADIEERDWHLSTGFVGLPYLLPVLSRFGRSDVAFRLLTNETYPSWGYEISHGATTIWERWNGYHHEDGPGDPNMNSYAHYAYGAVAEWLFSDVAGIAQTETGFAAVRIRPRVGGGLTSAEAEHRCIRGPIRSAWTLADDGRFDLEVSLPGNVAAEVHLPTDDAESVRLDGEPVATEPASEPGYRVLRVGGGCYAFSCSHSAAPVSA